MMHWAVVGGGFRGIVTAILLRQRGCAVTLIEKAAHLGGLLYSGDWEGLYIDRGAHLFDNVDDHITQMMHDILGQEIVPVDVRYAAVMADRKVDGLAVPDFTSLSEETKRRALFELMNAVAAPEGPAAVTLKDVYDQRFGKTLSDLLDGPTRKMLRAEPRDLAPESFISTPFQRLRFLDDSVTEILKKSPDLDDVIALPVKNDPLRHYKNSVSLYPHRNYYPLKKGMRQFCEQAADYLRKIGVDLRIETGLSGIAKHDGKLTLDFGGEALACDRLLWASPVGGLAGLLWGENPLMGWATPVPMLMYYYLVPQDRVGPYAYMHDFSEQHLLFRPSAIGRYGGQNREDGMTYVCLEVVTDRDSAEWNDPDAFAERVWQEAADLGVVEGPCPETRMVHAMPVTYVPPKPGFTQRRDALMTRLQQEFDGRVHALEQHAFSKTDIQEAIELWMQ